VEFGVPSKVRTKEYRVSLTPAGVDSLTKAGHTVYVEHSAGMGSGLDDSFIHLQRPRGIAFAITSDKEHASRGPSHAPIGAVDWITVFPPGGASKIFPMP